MQKTSGNEFLGPLVEIVFHIFPILHWIMKRRGRMGGGAAPYLLEFLWIMLQYLI